MFLFFYFFFQKLSIVGVGDWWSEETNQLEEREILLVPKHYD